MLTITKTILCKIYTRIWLYNPRETKCKYYITPTIDACEYKVYPYDDHFYWKGTNDTIVQCATGHVFSEVFCQCVPERTGLFCVDLNFWLIVPLNHYLYNLKLYISNILIYNRVYYLFMFMK